MTAKALVLLGVAGWLWGCAPGGGARAFAREEVLAPAGVELSEWRPACRTDLDCRAGDRCIHPAGATTRQGLCGHVVDAEGARLQVSARAVPGCDLRTDCPLPFSCLKLNPVDGLCVK